MKLGKDAAMRQKAMACEHANEVPQSCPCKPDCYCKSHTCKSVRKTRSSRSRKADVNSDVNVNRLISRLSDALMQGDQNGIYMIDEHSRLIEDIEKALRSSRSDDMADNWPNKKSLLELQWEVDEWAKEKGWNQKKVDVPAKLMLVVTELAEAMEEVRKKGFNPLNTYWVCPECSNRMILDSANNKWQCTAGYSTGCTYVTDKMPKPEGLPSELADVVIRVLQLCGNLGIDLDRIVRTKMIYNGLRAFKHGGKRM